VVYLPIYTWQLLRQYRLIGPTNYVRAYFASLVKFQKNMNANYRNIYLTTFMISIA